MEQSNLFTDLVRRMCLRYGRGGKYVYKLSKMMSLSLHLDSQSSNNENDSFNNLQFKKKKKRGDDATLT